MFTVIGAVIQAHIGDEILGAFRMSEFSTAEAALLTSLGKRYHFVH
jgi:hypothetical protein